MRLEFRSFHIETPTKLAFDAYLNTQTSPLRHSFQSNFKVITLRKKMINDICQREEKNDL